MMKATHSFKIGFLVLALSVGVSGSIAHAAMAKMVDVTGQLYNLTDKIVELKNETGLVKVPRSAVKDQRILKSNAMITVHVPLTALIYYNKSTIR